MNLHYFRLWPRLLTDMFDDDEAALSIGIGSVLNGDDPSTVRKYVMNVGAAHTGRRPSSTAPGTCGDR